MVQSTDAPVITRLGNESIRLGSCLQLGLQGDIMQAVAFSRFLSGWNLGMPTNQRYTHPCQKPF